MIKKLWKWLREGKPLAKPAGARSIRRKYIEEPATDKVNALVGDFRASINAAAKPYMGGLVIPAFQFLDIPEVSEEFSNRLDRQYRKLGRKTDVCGTVVLRNDRVFYEFSWTTHD